MIQTDRRAFIIRTGSIFSGVALFGFSRLEALLRNPAWQPVDLHTLAEAVLPEELGSEGIERVSRAFRTWLEEFPNEVQMSHGWGRAMVLYGPPDPGPRWAAQLRDLEDTAQRRHGKPFSGLSRPQQQTTVRAALTEADPSGGGSPGEAHHVAMGLMAFFFRSPEATNLCYRAEINAESCRFLETAGAKPAPLGSGG